MHKNKGTIMTELNVVANKAVDSVGDTLAKYGVEIDTEELDDVYELVMHILEVNTDNGYSLHE